MPEEAEGGRREEEVGSKSGYFVRTLDQPRREPTECKKEAPRMRRTARPLCCVTAVHHSRMQATPPARRAAMAPTESIRAAAGDLALAYAWTVVCFRAWDDALER